LSGRNESFTLNYLQVGVLGGLAGNRDMKKIKQRILRLSTFSKRIKFIKQIRGRYYHELKDEEVKKMIALHMTYGELMRHVKQPDWCEYPDALEGMFGCWSLMSPDYRTQISRNYCKNCDCYIKKGKGSEG